MSQITGYTADRMAAIEAASVVDGSVDSDGNLTLTKHDGSTIAAGNIKGPIGGSVWYGTGAPGTIAGSKYLDLYLDVASGDEYQQTGTNVWTKIGSLAQTYIDQVAALTAQQTSLMETAASIEELTVSTTVHVIWNTTAIASTVTAPTTRSFWVAPFPCKVVACEVMFDLFSLAANATNNLTVRLRTARAGGLPSSMVSKNSNTDEAIVARQAWNFDSATWNPANSQLQKGDGLCWDFQFTGSVTVQLPMTVTCQIQPL